MDQLSSDLDKTTLMAEFDLDLCMTLTDKRTLMSS